MSVQLLKVHAAFYTSTADIDKHVLKYYTDECKQSKAARARAEFAILKAWWDKQGFTSSYGGWCDTVPPRGFIVGGTFHNGYDYDRLTALIHDYKETFLPDYDDDNVWWGEGEEPLEGYALEHVWLKHNVYMTVNDSAVVRLGAHRRHLDLNIDVAVANDFYTGGGKDGLPF